MAELDNVLREAAGTPCEASKGERADLHRQIIRQALQALTTIEENN